MKIGGGVHRRTQGAIAIQKNRAEAATRRRRCNKKRKERFPFKRAGQDEIGERAKTKPGSGLTRGGCALPEHDDLAVASR